MKNDVKPPSHAKPAGEISNDTKIVVVELTSDLAPGNTFTIPQLPDLSLSSIDGIQIIIRPDNRTLVTQIYFFRQLIRPVNVFRYSNANRSNSGIDTLGKRF